MKQLNAHDAMFVHFDNEDWAAHGGIVGIYDPSTAPGGTVRFPDILAHIGGRLARSPIFRRRLVRVPLDLDHPYWVEDEHFDLESHVHHLRLPEPADWRQLCDTVARIDSRPLDLNRPLWEMHVIEGLDNVEGVPSGSFAIFTKLHHAAVDGHSLRDIISAIHDPASDIVSLPVTDDWSPEPRPGPAGLLARAVVNNLVRGPLRLARASARMVPAAGVFGRALVDGRQGSSGSLVPRPVPRTRFQTTVTPHRVLGGCVFQLEDVKRMRGLVDGSTVNDVIITIVGGAVRRYLAAKGETPTEPLVCGAPIDLRKGEESVGGNDIAFLAVALGAHIDDPVERLRRVHESTSNAKQIQRAVGARELSELSASFPGALSSLGFKTLAGAQLIFGNRLPVFNVGVSNVPGPQVPLYLNGARAERFFGVAPIFHGTALVFGVFSYQGAIEVTFVSCRRLLSDPEFLTECLRASYEELGSSELVAAR
jgi:diacylglycerol O-acyltransferase / wax synthase